MVMSISRGVVIMASGVDDLASYALTVPDRHSRPTATMLATAVERLHLPLNRHFHAQRLGCASG
jgi:hypothetical protein